MDRDDGRKESLEKDKRQIEALFSEIAEIYEGMNRIITFGMVDRWRRSFLDFIGPVSKGKVFDACCGSGALTLMIADKNPDARVTGGDFSPEMIREARRNNEVQQAGNVVFLETDVERTDFSPESFSLITCGFALRNLVKMEKVFAEFNRLLEEGGEVALMEVAVPSNPFIRFFFRIYFFKVMPFLADRIAAKDEVSGFYSPYEWLSVSIIGFPDPGKIGEMLEQAGFSEVETVRMNLGSVFFLKAKKNRR